MIDVFAEQEKLQMAAATELRVDPLSDSDLTLSPLFLPSRFVEDRFRAPFDPYGSNADLIGPEMASQLITSREITEEPSEEPMVDIKSAPTEHAEDEKEEADQAEKTSSPKPKEEEANSEIEKRSISSVPSSNADLLVPTSAQVEGPIASVTEDPVDPPAPSVLNGDDQDPAA
ncbi:hypothetical protein DY000_02054055 [Brassica cretica]|uniref:Uncharacterized protein n=1 Tax=Brassica cretica TaxID=69181 RepID=A0ABQ7A4X5_BRACR|nr:hypothetical protein DY000_02054055 [Brassica cretica]